MEKAHSFPQFLRLCVKIESLLGLELAESVGGNKELLGNTGVIRYAVGELTAGIIFEVAGRCRSGRRPSAQL